MEIKEILENTLRKEPNLLSDKGEIKKWIVINKAQNYDETLLGLLLDEPRLKTLFFKEIKKAWVFNLNLFTAFIEQKEFLPDSYTGFPNKIGLQIRGKFLRQRNEVSLVWPYKDCVLEGGQSREEDARKEIFFNELLAQDEITQLFEPKVITNVQYFGDAQELNSTSNLLIKGNNLLALHSLKKRFTGKVKLIYIDPPYNTGSDGFRYNDSFNHSSWLTFMKNRLEVAKTLLSEDGVIFIQCDDNEQAYLKVLCDDIFGSKNFVETFIWKNTDNAPALSKKTRKNIEFIHCYEKKMDYDKSYVGRKSDNDDAPLLNSGNGISILKFPPNSIKFKIPDGQIHPNNYEKIRLLNTLNIKDSTNTEEVIFEGRFKWSQSTLEREIRLKTYFLIKSEKMSIRYQREEASVMAPDKLIDQNYLSKAIGIETNEDSKKHLESLKLSFTSFPKPETLVSFLIKSVTDEGDIVLDFFAGSGTTAAVAHKMKRQYIGIEQMDYIETVTSARLKKVIDGEQGGISKAVNWQGGGSFVYLELKKYNEHFIEKIRDAQNTDELLEIWEEMKNVSFLNYNIDIKDQNKAIEELKTHSLEVQKQKLVSILDKNQLYVSVSNMEDAQYGVTQEEKEFTKAFYQND